MTSYCGSKENFIGHYHNYSNPAGVVNGKLDNTLNYNENSCGALALNLILQPGESKNIAFLLGMKYDEAKQQKSVHITVIQKRFVRKK